MFESINIRMTVTRLNATTTASRKELALTRYTARLLKSELEGILTPASEANPLGCWN
jgi:hypothetical protein